jgi:hypothetical protein
MLKQVGVEAGDDKVILSVAFEDVPEVCAEARLEPAEAFKIAAALMEAAKIIKNRDQKMTTEEDLK